MISLAHLPFVLAGAGALAGVPSMKVELALFGALAGYFLGKLLQSLFWTVSGPRTAA